MSTVMDLLTVDLISCQIDHQWRNTIATCKIDQYINMVDMI